MVANVLTVDIGASSGRVMLCCLAENTLELKEIHRFENNPIYVDETLCWDVYTLFEEIKKGIQKASKDYEFESIGIDTWGVDFGLIDENGLMSLPVHYRDTRTNGIKQNVFEIISEQKLYEQTGIQIMEINTLFQLFSLKQSNKLFLENAKHMLLMPDLLGWMLTGEKTAEASIASTTQLLNPTTKKWDMELTNKLGLPENLFESVVESGTPLGMLSQNICKELQIVPTKVISVAGHDTACAIAAIPAKNDDYLFISCGTWSLFGTETDSPIINEKSAKYKITNETGYGGKTDFLSNIVGLWLIQETRRHFKSIGQNYSFGELEEMALNSQPFAFFIDTDDDVFMPPGDIPKRIKEWCIATNQGVPKDDAQIIRCIYDSLAMKYRLVAEQIIDCTCKQYDTIHIVGGGANSALLCQLTSDTTGLTVVAGPVEATALGNAAIQLISGGFAPNLESTRQLIANSFDLKKFCPKNQEIMIEKYETFKRLIRK